MSRVLKQLGQGSVADGVYAVVRDPSAQVSVATVLGVEQHVLVEELTHLPRTSEGSATVDLSKMYSHLIAGKVLDSTVQSDIDQHRIIFNWCEPAALDWRHAVVV